MRRWLMIGSDTGLSNVQHQEFAWASTDLLFKRPFSKHFNKILVKSLVKNMHSIMSPAELGHLVEASLG